MKTLSTWQVLTTVLATAVLFFSCTNAPNDSNQSNLIENSQIKNASIVKSKNEKQSNIKMSQESQESMKELGQPVSTAAQQNTESARASSFKAELDKAIKEGKPVFVVVTGNTISNTSEAMKIAKAANQIIKKAVVLELNRDDAMNANFVSEWRLSGAPLPLIIALSSKGQPVGGYVLEQATAENIAALIPSPKLEIVYDAISKQQYAVLAFTKKSFSDRKEVLNECNKAVNMLKNEAVFIEIDMEDIKEIGFMNQLKINPSTANSSVTLVINKQGQVAGQSSTIPDAAKLVSAAKTPVKKGCGPGCGPAGCGK